MVCLEDISDVVVLRFLPLMSSQYKKNLAVGPTRFCQNSHAHSKTRVASSARKPPDAGRFCKTPEAKRNICDPSAAKYDHERSRNEPRKNPITFLRIQWPEALRTHEPPNHEAEYLHIGGLPPPCLASNGRGRPNRNGHVSHRMPKSSRRTVYGNCCETFVIECH